MPYTTSITPLASTTQSASGVGSAISVGAARSADLALDVTAAVGTSLGVSIETARSASATTWRTVDAFTTAAGTRFEEKSFAGLDAYVRVRWVVTAGTFTFSVTGSSILVLCTPAQMAEVIAERALVRDQTAAYSDAELDRFARRATDELSSSLGAVHKWPLTAWGSDVSGKSAELAVYYAMRARGYAPDEPSGKAYRQMYEDVQAWAELVRNQKIELQGVVDATPDVEDGGAYVVTNASRGWGAP